MALGGPGNFKSLLINFQEKIFKYYFYYNSLCLGYELQELGI